MNNLHGEIGWSDNVNFGGDKDKKKLSKDAWLHLDEGSNIVRLITNPHQYVVHKGIKVLNSPKGKKDFGRKVSCSIEHGSCPLCAKGYKQSTRWYLGVIDRKSGQTKILDISYQVYNPIRQLNKKTDVWGDPQKYDIDIIVDKNNIQQYYQVQPIPHKPLTPAEQKQRDEFDVAELVRRCDPFTPEAVQKIVDGIVGDGELAPPPEVKAKDSGAGKTASKSSAPPVVDMTDEESVDSMFPAHDGNSA